MSFRCLLLIVFLIIPSFSYSQEVKVFSVHSNRFLDDKNPFRYSPMGIIDNDATTVFATSASTSSPNNPVFTIDFSSPTEFDGISIQAGYFDLKYFLLNARIKKIKIIIRPDNKSSSKLEFEYNLLDKMETQELFFGKKIKSSGIDVFVTEIYKGTTWNDIVVSEFKCLLNGKTLQYKFAHDPRDRTGSFVWSQEDFRTIYHNKKPIQDTRNYHKMGWETTWSYYNPDGLLFSQYNRKATPDGNEDSQEIYFYKEEVNIPYRSTTFSVNGEIISENTFIYNKSQLIKKVGIGNKPSTSSYVYNGNFLIKKELQEKDMFGIEYILTNEYFYTNTKEIGEKVSLSKNNQITITLFQNVYIDNKVKFRIPVLVSLGTMDYAQELEYDGELVTNAISSLHSVF